MNCDQIVTEPCGIERNEKELAEKFLCCKVYVINNYSRNRHKASWL